MTPPDENREPMAEVLQERDRLRAWKKEAIVLFDGLQDLGRALDLPLGALITGPRALEAANALRAERDQAVEVRERVEQLADAWAAIPPYLASDYDRGRVDQREMCETELREVLAAEPLRSNE